jgi:hypothetical protein
MLKAILLNYSCNIQKKEVNFTLPFLKRALFVNAGVIKSNSDIIDFII